MNLEHYPIRTFSAQNTVTPSTMPEFCFTIAFQCFRTTFFKIISKTPWASVNLKTRSYHTCAKKANTALCFQYKTFCSSVMRKLWQGHTPPLVLSKKRFKNTFSYTLSFRNGRTFQCSVSVGTFPPESSILENYCFRPEQFCKILGSETNINGISTLLGLY